MSLLDDVKSSVSIHMGGNYQTFQPRDVPLPEDIPEGAKAAKLTATSLFIDLLQSSDITNALRRQTAAKMLKAFFSGAVRTVSASNDYVRSFNGDGMLALFRDERRSDNGVKAAMQVKWFVREILQPRFERYFESNRRAFGASLGFDVGCGLDDGDIYAVKVGIRGTNDVAWVGRCTNTSAKLSNLAATPRNILITRAVYQRLAASRRLSNGAHMWSDEFFRRDRRDQPCNSLNVLLVEHLANRGPTRCRRDLDGRVDRGRCTRPSASPRLSFMRPRGRSPLRPGVQHWIVGGRLTVEVVTGAKRRHRSRLGRVRCRGEPRAVP